MIVRWSAPLDLAALAMRGYVPPAGPLVDCADDAVLITQAYCDDKGRLHVHLEPTDATAHNVTLDFTNPTKEVHVGTVERPMSFVFE